MNLLSGIAGVLILAGLPLLFTWINKRAHKRYVQKMNKRFEFFDKYMKESGKAF